MNIKFYIGGQTLDLYLPQRTCHHIKTDGLPAIHLGNLGLEIKNNRISTPGRKFQDVGIADKSDLISRLFLDPGYRNCTRDNL